MTKGKVRGKSSAKDRPPIPEQTQRELWGRAAGRCEFRGCNEPLYRDKVSKKRSNLAVISHIVAYSPSGPRGDAIRSPLLAKDIGNLMLTCRNHGHIIDDKDKEADYPEVLLLEFKQQHEDRVRLLTESTEDNQTHVVLLQAPVDGQFFQINAKEAFEAILPYYPAEEQPFLIDLSGVMLGATTPGFFSVMSRTITERAGRLLERRVGDGSGKRLSVFAIAPIPLLVHFGKLLGDLADIDLYQKHRVGRPWRWREEVDRSNDFYNVMCPEPSGIEDKPVALLLSVSEVVNRARVKGALGTDPVTYEIIAKDSSRDFLRSRERLHAFSIELRKLLCLIRDNHPKDQPIHVFGALPAPLAIELGRNLKPFDAPFYIYEYEKAHRRFEYALTVNE